MKYIKINNKIILFYFSNEQYDSLKYVIFFMSNIQNI